MRVWCNRPQRLALTGRRTGARVHLKRKGVKIKSSRRGQRDMHSFGLAAVYQWRPLNRRNACRDEPKTNTQLVHSPSVVQKVATRSGALPPRGAITWNKQYSRSAKSSNVRFASLVDLRRGAICNSGRSPKMGEDASATTPKFTSGNGT